jgi:parallel beta-helix repeat protein
MKNIYKNQTDKKALVRKHFLVILILMIFTIAGTAFNAHAQYNVTGDDKCQGQSATIGLSNADLNEYYHLLRTVDDVNYTYVTFQNGQGLAFNYASQSVVGKYVVYKYTSDPYTNNTATIISSGLKQTGEVYIFANPVPTITGNTDVCAGSEETYTTESGMSGYTWTVVGGSGTSNSGSITVNWGTSGAGSVSVNYTDLNGCTAANPTILNVTKVDAPILSAVALKSTLNQINYQNVAGNLDDGYTLYLYACKDYTYLDVDALTATVDVLDGYLNPFFLDQTGLTQVWWDYWEAKDVTETYALANPTSWQAFMWDIINGDEPIFYLKKSGTDNQLIDGLQYQVGAGEQMLRISGDYPLDTYTYDGELYATAGCFSTLSINMTFERGVLNFTQQKTYGTIQGAVTAAVDLDEIRVCSGTYDGNITIDRNISLIGAGATTTIIDGDDGGGQLGAIQLTTGRNGVTIKGFHVKGIDNATPGIEKAAIYLQGAQTSITIEENIIEARGDAALMGEWNAANNTIIINNNQFTGKTFIGSEPATGNQFEVWNVARQAINFGGGTSTTNTQNFTFTDNIISTIAAGTTAGNTLVTLDLVGTNTISGNIFSGVSSANALRIRGTGVYTVEDNYFTGIYPTAIFRQGAPVLAEDNWFGSDLYSVIFPKIQGPVVFVPYYLDQNGTASGGGPTAIDALNVIYTDSNKDIFVQFDVKNGDMELYPMPGLNPADPNYETQVAARYTALAGALQSGVPVDIQSAALNIGDDVIIEYYYYVGTTKTYLQTINSNPLVKSKYWQKYLVKDDDVRYPSWPGFPGADPDWRTSILKDHNYRTHTNPGTGAVTANWLTPALGRDVYVTVTLIQDGALSSATKIVSIPAGCIVNTVTGLGYASIQDAINATETLDGHTITVCEGIFPGNINVTKSLTIIGDPGNSDPGPGTDAPIIDGGSAPGNGFKIANGVTNVTIKGFEIRNFTSNATGIGNGISAWVASTSNINIEDNFFHSLGWNGVMVGNDGAIGSHSNWLIKNNILETFYAYGFELTNTSNSSIENNIIHSDATSNPYTCILILGHLSQSGITINNNLIDGPFTGKGVGFPAIYVRAENGVNINNITIQQNGLDFTGTAQSVSLSADGTGTITNVALKYNRLSRLQLSKIYNEIDATNNFWGNENGPINSSVNTFKRGQQAGYITSNSWLPAISPWWKDISGVPGSFTGTSFSPITNDQGKMFSKFGGVEGALTGTLANGTLLVEAGTFGENVTIPASKPLTILGQNGTAFIGYSSNAYGLTLNSPITFSNFSAYSVTTYITVNSGGIIQNGVDFALPNGTVKVAAGTYSQDVTVPSGKSLTLRNTSGTTYARIASGNKLTLSSPMTLLYFSAFDAGTLTQINEGGLIQNGIEFAAAGGTVDVASGTFAENLNVNKGIILKGANADLACGSRGAESKIAPAAGLPISVTADGVTINGFEITGPAYQNAIVCGNRSNLTIKYNNIHNIGTTVTGENVHAINYTVANTASTSNVNILNNCFDYISSSSLTGYSAAAIGFLQSTSTGMLTGLNIERNTINNVNVNTGTWPTGKVAYGIIINTGGGSGYLTSDGKVVNAAIKQNEITNLEGFISTGIGLEGNTENVIVQNNYVANLKGNKVALRAGGGYDLQGLKFENNRYVGTATVTDNSFATNTYTHNATGGVGYAVANYVPEANGGELVLGCNWYGTAVYNEIADNATLTGKILNKEDCETTFIPYLLNGTDHVPGTVGFQPMPGTCEGDPIEIAAAVSDHITCGETTGSIVVTFSDGTAPYNIEWTGGGSSTNVSSPYNITGLAAGTYDITVTDANGSFDEITVDVDYMPVTLKDASLAIVDYYPTIQDAIDAASSDYTIEVCAGTYIEDVTTLGEPLGTKQGIKLIGATNIEGEPSSIIQGSVYFDDNDNGKVENIRFVPNTNHLLTLKNTNGFVVKNSIFDGNNTTNVINGINHVSGPNGNSAILVENCKFIDGLYVSIGSRFSSSAFYGHTFGLLVKNSLFDNVKSGINHQGGDDVIVESSEFNLNGNNSYGVRFASDASNHLTITESKFAVAAAGDNKAIWLRANAGGTLLAQYNLIGFNVLNESTALLNATCNWYGAADADAIDDMIEGNVQFLPFLVVDNTSGTTYPWDNVNEYSCNGVGPVVNQTKGISYMTIQAAIDDANPVGGDVIKVAAGPYVEDIIVDRAVTLLGPNAEKCGDATDRLPEATIYPATSSPFGEIIKVQASDVTIKGFLIDGDNPSLTSEIIGTNGADLDAAEAVTVYVDNVNNLTVKNNIVKNLTYFGVTIFGASYSAPVTTGHLVDCNKFQDLGTYLDPETNSNNMNYWGGGVLIYNDQYTRVVNNVMTNVRMGIQTGNYHRQNPGDAMYQVIDNNTIQARRMGIFYNLHTGNPAPLTLSNNTITALSNSYETKWRGIALSSLSEAVGTASNNTINGSGLTVPSFGYEVWNVKSNAPSVIYGGTVSNVDIGVFANNFEGYASNGTNGAHALVSGVTITTKTGGVGVKAYDSPLYTGVNPAPVVVTVKDNCSISGAATGILAEGADASVTVTNNLATITGNEVGIRVKDGATLASVTGNTITNNTHGGIIIESNAGTIGVINNNTISGNGATADPTHGLGLQNDLATVVDATSNWWGDASGPYHSVYNTCGSGNAVVGLVDISPWLNGVGGSPVNLLVKNTTINKFYCTIQDAIDDPMTLNGHTIIVAAGSYPENLLVHKELIITGAGAASTTILAGAGIAVEITADNVTIQDFEIKHSTVTTLADMGIRLNMSNGSTIQNNKFTVNSLGIQLLDAGDNHIYQNEFVYNAIGIYFEGTTDGINFDGGSNGPFYSLSLNNIVEENNIHHSALISGQGGQGIYLDAACEKNEFINNTISNNAAIGYYAWKASNNTLTGNMIQNNASEGIQLQGSSDNTITGNTVSGSPVGFWMRSPAENVTNNTITGNSITGNVVGIKMEDDYSTNNWPGVLTGNIISGNKITGNGFGLQVIDAAPGTVIDATCNWWGTEDAAVIATLVSSNVDFLEFLVVDNTNGTTYPWDNTNKYACGGVGPVTVYNAVPAPGSFVSSHMTIQAAIDASTTLNGYYVNVASGIYPEVLYLAKELDIRGPNYGINPNNGATRNPEATIQFPASNTSWYLMYIDGDGGGSTVSGVSINGFEFDGVHSYGGTYPTELIFIAGAENVSIKDNILKNFEQNAIRYYYQYWDGANYVPTWPIGADISDNHILNPDFYADYSTYGAAPGHGIYLQGVYGSVTGNVVEHVLSGCQIQPYGHANTTSITGTVSGNTFKGSRNGLWYNNSSSANADWLFSSNTLSGIQFPTGYTPAANWYGEPTNIWYGFAINGNSYGEVSFTGNTIQKGATTLDAHGIRYVHGYAHAPKTTITSNTIDNLAYGIYLPTNLANIGEIAIYNNSISGNSDYGLYNGTSTDVNATPNYWGDPTGPVDSTNPCGLGNPVSDNVLFSPWYYEGTMTTLNGLPYLTLSDMDDISTITGTPVIISLTVEYPDLTGYDPDVLADALISTTTAFPAGTKVINVVYDDGVNPAVNIPVNYDLSSNVQHYLSDILGNPSPYGQPLYAHSLAEITWTITIEGATAPISNLPVSIQSLSYIDRTVCVNELGAPALFDITYAAVSFAYTVTTPACFPYPIDVDYIETYPLVENIGGNRVLNDSKWEFYSDAAMTIPVELPIGTQITVGQYSGTTALWTRTVTLNCATSFIYGSEIVSEEDCPNSYEDGHLISLERPAGATPAWKAVLEGIPAGTYYVKVKNMALLDATGSSYDPVVGPHGTLEEYVYDVSTFTVVYNDAVQVQISVDGTNPLPALPGTGSTEVCVSESFEMTLLDIVTGVGPLTFIYKVYEGTDNTGTPMTGSPFTVPDVEEGDPIYQAAAGSLVAGTYFIETLSITDVNGCGVHPGVMAAGYYNHTLIIHELPTATISGTNSICVGNVATLTVNLTGEAPWTYYWSKDGGATSTAVNATSSPSTFTDTPGSNATYTVVSVTDANGCTNTGTGSATIYLGPTTIAPEIVGCPGTVIEFPITVTNFNQVGSVSLQMIYDKSVMTYNGFASGYSAYVNGINAIEPDSEGYGRLIVSGFNSIPLNLSDSTVLFTLKFNYLGGTTQLVFDDRGGNANDDTWCEYGYGVPGPGFIPFCDGDVPGTWPGSYPDFADPAYYVNGKVTETIKPVISGTVTGPDDVIEMISGNPYTMTICSGELVTTSPPSSTSLDPSACGPLRIQSVYTTDISTLPATQTFDLLYSVASQMPPTSITPENHDGVAKNIIFVSTPYYDVDGSGTLNAGDHIGNPITFTLTVQPMPAISNTVTSPNGYSQIMVSGGSYAHTTCSHEELTTSIPTLTSTLADACGVLRIRTDYTSTLLNIPSATLDATFAQAQLLGPQTISPENHTATPQTITFVTTPYYDVDNSGSLTAGDILGDLTTFVLTVQPITVITAIDLATSIDELNWTAVGGDLDIGYKMCIDPVNHYHYLDIITLTSPVNSLLSTGYVQNAFYLNTTTLPAGFYPYWATKGVESGASGWQGVMWDIINGDEPMLYINYTGSDYQLIDGLQHLIGNAGQTLRISGDYPQGLYTFTGSVTDVNGCISTPFDVDIQLNSSPVISEITLLTSIDQSSWAAVSGTLTGGYEMCIDPVNQYHYLDINTLTGPVNSLLSTGYVQNAFYLNTTTLSAGFYPYWATKGVESGASGWQGIMWDIINGDEPMLYINYTGSDYQLIDGLQHLIGNAGQTLRISGDYPQGLYTFTGSVTDVNGCVSTSFDVDIQLNSSPVISEITLLTSIDQSSWAAVSGTLTGGYEMCIDPVNQYHYLDINTLTGPVNSLLSTGYVQNAFYLNTTTLPAGFYPYWASKGVESSASGWQGIMWDIINGDEPMLYINYTGSDYQLIDGLQHLIGNAGQTLRISGDYPQGLYTFTGSVTDVNGCISTPFDVDIQLNSSPVISEITLLTSIDQSSWAAVSGTLTGGYEMCIDPVNQYHYLDINTLTGPVNNLLSTGYVQNAFYLNTTTLPAGFYPYWASKGVESSASGWQGIMWDIINGDEPMLYINYTGSDYQLIDGLQHLIGNAGQTLRISGDYPQGLYTFTGSVTDVNGCISTPFDVDIQLNSSPVISEITLLTSIDQSTWAAVSGTLTGGYEMCIDPVNQYHYLDINTLTGPVNNLLSTGYVQNAFYLNTTTLPAGFYPYWASKGVESSASGWQGIMWDIINGDEPMLYINYTGSDYQLIDGLQHLIGNAGQTLRISGDYPPGTYVFTGTVTDINGCVSSPISVSIKLDSAPVISCPADITQDNDAGLCGASVSFAATATGIPVPQISYNINGTSISSPYFFPIGTTTVQAITTNDCGTKTCEFDVTVVDSEFPQITFCPPAVTIQVNESSNPGVTGIATATDNCDVSVTFSDVWAAGSCAGKGVITRTWKAEDPAGNSVNCLQLITIIDDQTPAITCPTNIVVDNDEGLCSAVVNFADPVSLDPGYFEGWEAEGFTTGDNIGWSKYNSNLASVASGTNGISSFDGNRHGLITPPDEAVHSGVFSRLGGYTNYFCNGYKVRLSVYMDLTDQAVIANTYGWDLSVASSTKAGGHLRDFIFHTASNVSGNILVGGSNNSGSSPRTDLANINHHEISASGWYIFEWEFRNQEGSLAVDLNLLDANGTHLWTETRYTAADLIATIVGGNRYMWFTFLATDQLAIDDAKIERYTGISSNYASGYAFPVGTTEVVYTSTDCCGNDVECSFDVTVNDNDNPVLTLPTLANPYTADPGDCFAELIFTATATDNCGVDGFVYKLAGDVITFPYEFPVGTTTVNVLVTDIHGNTDEGSFNVTVEDDEDPILTLPTLANPYTADPGDCFAELIFAASATDNCGVDGFVYKVAEDVITFPYEFPVGTTTVNVLVTDIHGNTDEGSFNVTVEDDEDPILTLPTLANPYTADPGDCFAELIFAATATDNCGVDGFVYKVAEDVITFPYEFPVGTTTVNVLVTDIHGNTDEGSFNVTVEDDEDPILTLPTLANPYTADPGDCFAELIFAATATDNCGVDGFVYKVAGDVITFPYEFAVGTTTVNVLVTDIHGNTDEGSFNVTVEDDEDPILTLPTLANPYTADPGDCFAELIFAASATDNCGVDVFVYKVAEDVITFPYEFPVGTTTVNVLVTDIHGNTDEGSFNVTVEDDEDPILTLPTLANPYTADPGDCFAELIFAATATDNCGVDGFVYKVAGDVITFPYEFAVGTTTVNVLVTDIHGNTDEGSFNVTVEDDEDPILTLPTLANPYTADPGDCFAELIFAATATDNCGVDGFVYKVAGDVITFPYEFPVGTTTVNVLITDIHGNTDEGPFNVTVEDNEPPSISCPVVASSYDRDLPCAWEGIGLDPISIADNCGTPDLFYSVDGGSSWVAGNANEYLFPVGATTVTYKVVDASNNETTCSFVINVRAITLSGNIVYNNGASTPMNAATITLKQAGFSDKTTTADGSGNYSFDDICLGTWEVHLSTTKVAGGINATDAAMVNYWGTGSNAYAVEKVKFYTGDVNASNRIEAVDAGRIQSYFLQLGNPTWQNRDKWTFWLRNDFISVNPSAPSTGVMLPNITVTAGEAALTRDFWALSTGDFNGSWTPMSKKASETLSLNHGETITVDVGAGFELPLFADMDMEVGAISLILEIPADKLNVNGIWLGNNPSIPLAYEQFGNELRIAWFSLTPVTLTKGDNLLTIDLTLTKALDEGEQIYLSLAADPLNELANGQYIVISNAELLVNVIKSSAVGIPEIPSANRLAIANYPNPFLKTTILTYSLPVDGDVTIEIYNVIGEKVKMLVNTKQVAGDYALDIDAGNWGPGVYTATIKLQTSELMLMRTIKIVRQQ